MGEDGQSVLNANPNGRSVSGPGHGKARDHDWGYLMVRTRSRFHSRVLGRLGAGSRWGFPGGSDGKEAACLLETGIRSLGREDPLEKGMATHSSILA